MTVDDATDLADLVTIAREISELLRSDRLSRSQRESLDAQYADAHAEINELLGFVVAVG